MYQHQHTPLPLEKLEHVPQPVLVLIEVLLEKDPGRRFQNPADLLNALPKVTEAVKARHTITHQSLREIAAQRPGASGKAIQILTNIRDVIAARRVRLILWPALVLVSVALSIWLLQSQQHSNEQLLALQRKFEKLEQGVNSFAEVQNKVRQEQPGQKPEQLEQITYDVLGKQLGIDPVTLRNQLPRFAQELKKRRIPRPMSGLTRHMWPRITMRRSDCHWSPLMKRSMPALQTTGRRSKHLNWLDGRRRSASNTPTLYSGCVKPRNSPIVPGTPGVGSGAICYRLLSFTIRANTATPNTSCAKYCRAGTNLGPEHPDTLTTRQYLASALFYKANMLRLKRSIGRC